MKRKSFLFAMLAVVTISLATGCTGIRASGGVSPLTFLLPGLVQHEEPAVHPTGKPPLMAAR